MNAAKKPMHEVFAENAKGKFMRLTIFRKKPGLSRVSPELKKRAAEAGNANPDAIVGSVRLLGDQNQRVNDVIGIYTKAFTYCDKEGLKSPIKNEWIFPVDKMPEAFKTVTQFIEQGDAAKAEFLRDYANVAAAAKVALADYDDVDIPSLAAMDEKLGMKVMPPEFMMTHDPKMFDALPASWAAAAAVKAMEQVEDLQQQVFERVEAELKKLTETLSNGKYRVVETRTEKLKELASQIESVNSAGLNDPRVTGLSSTIREKIVPALADPELNKNEHRAKEVVAAASKITKGMDTTRRDFKKAKASVADKSNIDLSSGLLGDML